MPARLLLVLGILLLATVACTAGPKGPANLYVVVDRSGSLAEETDLCAAIGRLVRRALLREPPFDQFEGVRIYSGSRVSIYGTGDRPDAPPVTLVRDRALELKRGKLEDPNRARRQFVAEVERFVADLEHTCHQAGFAKRMRVTPLYPALAAVVDGSRSICRERACLYLILSDLEDNSAELGPVVERCLKTGRDCHVPDRFALRPTGNAYVYGCGLARSAGHEKFVALERVWGHLLSGAARVVLEPMCS